MRTEELSAEYDRLYEEADRLLEQHNPCQFVGNKCISNRTNPHGYDKENGCCNDCDWLGSSGCVTKCLKCKIHTCTFITIPHNGGVTQLGRVVV